MNLIKILHAADLHMDRSFEGIKQFPKTFEKQLLVANQQMVKNIIETALTEQVDAVIFAGDTFHQSRSSIRTQALFVEQLERLAQAQIPVFLTFGNHDYYLPERYWFTFPENVHIFASETVETVTFQTASGAKVALSGFSYTQPWLEQSKVEAFPVHAADADLHIGIYHGELGQLGGRYAPFSLSEMKRKGYDYWALGHIHQPQRLSEAPPIVYPGTPLGHTKKEDSVAGVALVTFDPTPEISFVPVAPLSWETTTISLSACVNLNGALQHIEQVLRTLVQDTACLLSVELEAFEHLGQEFLRSFESGELLQYLQDHTTSGALFLYELSLAQVEQEAPLPLAVSEERFAELTQQYVDEAAFQQVTQELSLNPRFAALHLTADWQEASLAAASQKIKETFSFGGQEYEDNSH